MLTHPGFHSSSPARRPFQLQEGEASCSPTAQMEKPRQEQPLAPTQPCQAPASSPHLYFLGVTTLPHWIGTDNTAKNHMKRVFNHHIGA